MHDRCARTPPPAEQRLWARLRDRQLNGIKFRRQQPVGPFIADFFCAELKLVIELDGESHLDRAAHDTQRTQFLEREGLQIVRFVNTDVFDNLDGVLEEIMKHCDRRRASKQV